MQVIIQVRQQSDLGIGKLRTKEDVRVYSSAYIEMLVNARLRGDVGADIAQLEWEC